MLITDAVNDILMVTEGIAKERAGFRTGNLRRNITHDRAEITPMGDIEGRVGVRRTAPYGLWHHEGTGNFGRYHRAIRPSVGNVLVWRHYPSGRTVFARSVVGQRANPFIREAFDNVRIGYVRARLGKLANDIGNVK